MKSSNVGDLAGEHFFYRELARRVPRLIHLFPQLHAGSDVELKLELVQCTPLSRVFAEGRMRPHHLEAVVSALSLLHAVSEAEVPLSVSPEASKRFLAEKTVARFKTPEFAGLVGASGVLQMLLARLETYEPSCVRVIHGDAWFANILFVVEDGASKTSETSSQHCVLKFVDMRGRLGNKLTLNGDPMYDYAKLLQSLLGFDEAVFGFKPVPQIYRARLLTNFFSLIRARGVRPCDVFTVALCLMAGSIPFHDRREEIWRLVSSLCFSK